MKSQIAGLSALIVLIAGCNTNSQQDTELNTVISDLGLTGNPVASITDLPDISDPEAVLGKRLFFSKALGGDRDSACVSCHHPVMGGGDDLSLSVGVGAEDPNLLGPGRLHSSTGHEFDGGPTVPRNAPTTFNIAAYTNSIFHDGRLETVPDGIRTPDTGFGAAAANAGANLAHAQARFPITSPEEMKGFDHQALDNQGIRDFLAQRVGGYGAGAGELIDNDYWPNQFRTVFNDPDGTAEALITEQNISFLLGAYERSQVFVDTPWKAYIEGDINAISGDARRVPCCFMARPVVPIAIVAIFLLTNSFIILLRRRLVGEKAMVLMVMRTLAVPSSPVSRRTNISFVPRTC